MKIFMTIIAAFLAASVLCSAKTHELPLGISGSEESAFVYSEPNVSAPAAYGDALNSISVSYGVLSGVQAAYTFARFLGLVFSMGTLNLYNVKYSGNVSVDYMRSVSRIMDLGFVVSTENINGNNKVMNLNTHEYEYGGTFNETFSCFMPQVRLNYIKFPNFALYCKLALGTCWHHSEQWDKAGLNTVSNPESFSFCMHFTPIGWEVGGRNLRGFMELGVGWLGSLSFGARMRF